VEGDSPKPVQKQRGKANTAADLDAEVDSGKDALDEFGAGIAKASKSASNSAGQSSPLTFKPDELMNLNIANRPGGKGGSAD